VEAIRIGIIGLRMGSSHLEAARGIPGVVVRAICDVDQDRLAEVKARYGIEHAYADCERMISDPELDVVVVASPDHFHRDHTVHSLQAGKHVLCEKPMAPTLAECADMVKAARSSKRTLAIGHIVRFTPIFAYLKRVVERGELGQLYYVSSSYEHDYARVGGAWRFDPKLARHVFLGGGCHAVDLVRYFLGDFERVVAAATHIALPQMPLDDTVAALYSTAQNQIGQVFVGGGARRPYNLSLALYGTKGTALATNVDAEARIWTTDMQEPLGDRWMTIPAPIDNHPTRTQLQHFIDCLRAGQEPLVTGEEGMRTVAAALAAIEASVTGQAVQVPKG